MLVRWIVSIVTALCLLAAANERPDPRHYGSHDHQLTIDKHGATACARVRRGGFAQHPRLAAFVAAVGSLPAPPRLRARAVATAFPRAPAARKPLRSTWIRGPPLG